MGFASGIFFLIMAVILDVALAQVPTAPFERLPNYSMRSVPLRSETPATLDMCLRSCLAKRDCASVIFQAANLTCVIFASTGNDSDLVPQSGLMLFRKMSLSENLKANCSRRLWAMDRYPNRALLPPTSSLSSVIKVIDAVPNYLRCYELCQQDTDINCVAGNYNLTTGQCTLLPSDRRSDPSKFVASFGNDYFENQCLNAKTCQGFQSFMRYNDVVFPPFYFDRTVMAVSAERCSQICISAPDFLCRSFLFDAAKQECILSHNDNFAIGTAAMPAIPRIYAVTLGRPLTEFYESICLPGSYSCPMFTAFNRHSFFEIATDNRSRLITFENSTLVQCQERCFDYSRTDCQYLSFFPENATCVLGSMIKQRTYTPRGFVGPHYHLERICTPATMVPSGRSFMAQNPNERFDQAALPSTSSSQLQSTTVQSAPTRAADSTVPVTLRPVTSTTGIPVVIGSFNGSVHSQSILPPIVASANVSNLSPGSLSPGCQRKKTTGRLERDFVAATIVNVSLDTCQLQCQSSLTCPGYGYSEKTRTCELASQFLPRSLVVSNATNETDFAFYEKGPVCVDVQFECTDSAIVIKATMDRPFFGRLFIEGADGDQCSAKFSGQRNLTWSVPLSAEVCNTQYDGNGVFVNTVTLQYHSQLVTKNDKRYQVSCVFDFGLINLTSGVFAVGDQIQKIALEVPQLRTTLLPPQMEIRITNASGAAVNSAVIGETLLFNIIAKTNSSYGIWAKNCFAVGNVGGERMQLTDQDGCPLIPEFFRPFRYVGRNLQADFDAFRFQNSHDITYQCTIQYCIDFCPQPTCFADGSDSVESSRWKREATREIGSYNLRGRLNVIDSRVESTPLRDSQVCLNTAVTIILLTLAALFFAADFAFFAYVVCLRKKGTAKG